MKNNQYLQKITTPPQTAKGGKNSSPPGRLDSFFLLSTLPSQEIQQGGVRSAVRNTEGVMHAGEWWRQEILNLGELATGLVRRLFSFLLGVSVNFSFEPRD